MLNALALSSIYVFDQLLHPLVRDQQKWLHRNVGWFYRVLWLFPVVGTSLYLNVRIYIGSNNESSSCSLNLELVVQYSCEPLLHASPWQSQSNPTYDLHWHPDFACHVRIPRCNDLHISSNLVLSIVYPHRWKYCELPLLLLGWRVSGHRVFSQRYCPANASFSFYCFEYVLGW